MKSSGRLAAATMRRWSLEGKQGFKGYCLRACRSAWNLPGDEPSALKEWQSIPSQFKSTNPALAPIGAPHFWHVGEFGHVALQSGSFGFVWSTDAPKSDRIGLVDLEWFEKHWGAEYLGWSSQFQNKKLPLKEMPRVY